MDGFMLSDTLLSLPLGHLGRDIASVGGQVHALKIHIVASWVAIGIAGEFDFGVACVQKFKKLVSTWHTYRPDVALAFEKIVKEMLIERKKEPNATSFLLLSISETQSHLWKVDDGNARECTRAYIGDSAAYSDLMANYANLNCETGLSLSAESDIDKKETGIRLSKAQMSMIACYSAMQNIKSHEGVGNIAGISLRVARSTISRSLEYMQEGAVGRSPEEGLTGYTWMASVAPYSIGLYFREGKMGFIFPTGDERYSYKIEEDSLEAFKKQAFDRFGVVLGGVEWPIDE
jgi:hypothetical protein